MGIGGTQSSGENGSTDTHRQDELFTQLAHPVRRRVLERLVRGDGEVRAAGVAATATDRDRLALRHVHLPKLAYAGYVEWDPDAGTVRRGREFATVEATIELLLANERTLPGSWG
ncbi:hypothetical protein ACFQRB_10390 [Halobaculum litoreum]|uniref:DUF7344 domain-containing protein n=1 Tax=Halobaculum litoreum TaxID=3031998 RepID=A0ABD5XSZ2_9EURY